MAMLNTIKKIVIGFAQAFDQFADKENLNPVSVKLLDYSPINIAGDSTRNHFITFELSTRHRSHDFRLLFASKGLDDWHKIATKNDCLVNFIRNYQFIGFKLSKINYNSKHRALEVSLDRRTVLNSFFTTSNVKRDIVFAIYQRFYDNQNSLTNERIGIVWKILVRFLQNQNNHFQMIEGGLMNNLPEWCNNYVELLRTHSQNLIAHPSNGKYLICICHEQEYLKFEYAKNALENESYPINFILIRIASIKNNDRSEYFNNIYKSIQDHDIEIESDEYQTKLSSIIHLLSLFTSKLSTPVEICSKNYVKLSVSLIYNINRIKKILNIYDEKYNQISKSNENIDYTVLCQDDDWFILWHHIRIYDQTISQLHESILDNNGNFEPNRIIDQTRKLLHIFSVYYRNVKVLLEPYDHVYHLIRARIQLCNQVLQRLLFFFNLANVNF